MARWSKNDVVKKLLVHVPGASQEDIGDALQVSPALVMMTKAEIQAFGAWFFLGEGAPPDKLVAKAVRTLDEYEARMGLA